jgi:hypothetical protein
MPAGAKIGHDDASVALYWLPLGAGGHSVRWNGRLFEALVARHQHRSVRDLYHSALEVCIGDERYVIEMTPVWADKAANRGVVREGPVGSRWLGRSALFRYEVRLWRDGVIPDVAEAVASPRQVGKDVTRARRLLELVPRVPPLTWGRDQLRTGDMWNSNSLTSWLLASSDHEVNSLDPPANGRAPGWRAGLVVATHTCEVLTSQGEGPTRRCAAGTSVGKESSRVVPGESRSPGPNSEGPRQSIPTDRLLSDVAKPDGDRALQQRPNSSNPASMGLNALRVPLLSPDNITTPIWPGGSSSSGASYRRDCNGLLDYSWYSGRGERE